MKYNKFVITTNRSFPYLVNGVVHFDKEAQQFKRVKKIPNHKIDRFLYHE